ncbi:3-phosphoshikimate 1-carboxyvinyltransferase [Horticoccus sp. 23ND18S-11]|uniref:3-phosphoshikimate 1-carboxyvinyltransferase n=1 Tax=Horticoccus sp. 23ND18S-11 TaxID=3391832 RepID=UPI0039C96D0A
MPLPDVLPIMPFTRPARGEVVLPGSKSLTNRALPLAALCDAPVTLSGALFSEDTQLMSAALRELGFAVTEDAARNEIRIEGRGGEFPVAEATLFVGLAGTAARFLTALCAAAPRGVYRLDGVPQMRKRPMKPLLDALRTLGADIRCTGQEGFFPLEIHARGLAGGAVELDASESSQLLSALLMVAPLARGDVTVTLRGSVRWSYVDMTAQVMQAFTAEQTSLIQRRDAQSFTIAARTAPYHRSGGRYAIEPDASAASYFLALPLVTSGQLSLLGAQDAKCGLQGDTEFADVVRAVGGSVTATTRGLDVAFAPGGARSGLDRNFKAISDTFLTLAAIAPLLRGPTRISGIAHTRKQETDRVAGMARELTRLGQRVVETEDALEIHPQPVRAGEPIETYHDHRFAMSFGVLGCHDLNRDGQPWLSIKDPACCAKTFPHFFELLERLRQKSLAD